METKNPEKNIKWHSIADGGAHYWDDPYIQRFRKQAPAVAKAGKGIGNVMSGGRQSESSEEFQTYRF